MTTKLAILLLATCAIAFAVDVQPFHRVMVQDPAAKCLDGTAPAYYVSMFNTKQSEDKFIIYFEGGGWCYDETVDGTIANCYARAQTDLGSSKNYPELIADMGGILSGNPANNPEFWDWNRVYVKYCDGTGHQGYATNSTVFNGTELWFRGSNNTYATINQLIVDYIFAEATDMIVSGGSAGGLATYTWANYIKSVMHSPNATVVAAPDSGFFIDYENNRTGTYDYRLRFQNFMQLSNKEVDPVITECVNDNQDAKWKCMFAQYMVNYMKVPVFFIESEYDSWSLGNILGMNCHNSGSLQSCSANDRAAIEGYRNATVELITASLEKNPDFGAWMPACINHVYNIGLWNTTSYEVPQSSGFTLANTLFGWYMQQKDPNNWQHFDAAAWPSNSPCSQQKSIQSKFMA